MAAATPKISAKFSLKVLPPDFFSLFKKGAQLEATKSIKKVAHEVVNEAKRIISEQRYNWKPLSPRYKASKKRRGLDERIMIATRDYYDNGIGVFKVGKYICTGPLPKKHKGSRLTYQLIARFLEFGTRNHDDSGKAITNAWRMPPRPLWRPVKSIALSKTKALRKAYAKALRERMRDQLRKASRKEFKSKP